VFNLLPISLDSADLLHRTVCTKGRIPRNELNMKVLRHWGCI